MKIYDIKRLFVVILLSLILAPKGAWAGIIVVSPKGTIQSLSHAVELSADGDTIIVEAGRYEETDLIIDKSITIIGRDFPVISRIKNGHVIRVTASGVTISGLTVTGARTSFVNDYAAILLDSVSECIVEGNRLQNNFFAIYLSSATNCLIEGNEIVSSAVSQTTSGNGIHLWYCRDIEINDNQVSGHRDGIYLEFVESSRITNNVSQGNLRYGLHFMFSDSCLYSGNVFASNGAGVAVMYSNYVQMFSNSFKNNWGASSYGLLLKDINDSEVNGNDFYKNSVAIYIEGCNRIDVIGNTFRENGWGMKIMSNTFKSKITRNNFISNSFQVSTNSRNFSCSFDRNYWSNYSGYDLDRDGFGDVPFRPVSLFSLVVEQNSPTLILHRSLLITLLDLAERVVPSLTPANVVDNEPSMKRLP